MPAIKSVSLGVLLAAALLFTTGFFGSSVDPIAAGDKVGVLVMHGKGGTTKWVDSLGSALRSAGARVEMPDMPWHRNRIYDKTFDASMAEIKGHVDALRSAGAEQVFVAGHSLGAAAAAGYAARHDVDGIILLAPGHFVSAYGFSGKLADDVRKARLMIDNGQGAERASFGDVNAGKRATRNISADIYYSWFSPDGPADFVTNMAKLRDGVAVLYVAGSRDKIPNTKDKGYAFLKAPTTVHNRFEMVDAGHVDVPSRAKKQVASWLNEVSSFDAAAMAEELVDALTKAQKRDRKAIESKLKLLGASASPALTVALQDASADVRETAATLLGNARDPQAIDALIATLDDPDPEVRWSAVSALEEIGDGRARRALKKLRSDPDEDVREAVEDALSALSLD